VNTGFTYLSRQFTEEDFQGMSSSGNTVLSFQQGIDFLCNVIEQFKVPKGQNRQDHRVVSVMYSTLNMWWKSILECILLKHPEKACEGVQMMLTKLKDSDETSRKSLAREHFRNTFDKELSSKVGKMKMEQYVIYARNYGNIPQSVSSFVCMRCV
jgi:hypothetical protein